MIFLYDIMSAELLKFGGDSLCCTIWNMVNEFVRNSTFIQEG